MLNAVPTVDPIDQLIDRFTEIGIQSTAPQRERLRALFTKPEFKFITNFPCPSYTGTQPFQPVPGQAMTFSFTTSVVPFNYTLVILDVTGATPVVVFTATIEFTAPPFEFNIPAGTFVAGHDYSFILYPSLKAVGGIVVPFGCVSTVPKSTITDAITLATFAALELPASFPC